MNNLKNGEKKINKYTNIIEHSGIKIILIEMLIIDV